MNAEKIVEAVEAIRDANPGNLMARHFDADYFRGLDGDEQQRLAKIFASGLENPDSSMGAYAMAPDDYDRFSQQLDPMIRDFHGISPQSKIAQQHDWAIDASGGDTSGGDTSGGDASGGEGSGADLGAIDDRLKEVSMRVRVARNVASFPLPGAMNRQQRAAFEDVAVAAFEELFADDAYGGKYLSITPGSDYEIDKDEYDRRVAAHQMFKDMSADRFLNVAGISGDWPYGRGMYVSADEDFLVWVGEEDHLRIMAMMSGGDLAALFNRLRNGIEVLSQALPTFATSPVYGNVTSCPTNLGAGMRASLHMKLPNLTQNGTDLSTVTAKAKELGLAVRGAGGEHSDAGSDGLVDVSPGARLGVTEKQIMQRLYDGAAALWALEQG